MKWRLDMLRKLAVLVCSTVLVVTPMNVQALGFAGIKLKSALNEKLVAEVDLISATEDDVQSLLVKIATQEAYLRAGIDRSFVHTQLEFKMRQRANGDHYIHITSKEAIREPFLNFLLEMNWKNGRMLREYTMLLDPPGSRPQSVAEPEPVVAQTEPEPVAEPTTADSTPFVEPVPEMQPEPAPMMTDMAPDVASQGLMGPDEPTTPPEAVEYPSEMAQADTTPDLAPPPAVEPPAPIEEPMPMAAMEEPIPAPEPVEVMTDSEYQPDQPFTEEELFPRIPLTDYQEDSGMSSDMDSEIGVATSGEMGDMDYGITQKNDNLWSIAEKMRQGDDSVTVYQVMMALLQSNPDAFVDNNIHRLKVGHVLRINDPSLLVAMSKDDAAHAYIEQTDKWNEYRQQVAEAAGVQPIMAGEDSVAAEVASTESAGELTLTAPDGQDMTAGGGVSQEAIGNDLATLQEQLRQAKTDAGTMRSRNVALNNKLQDLEDELNRLQRSLSVKDDELAALQQQLSELNKQPVPAPVAEAKPEAPTPTAEVAEPVVAEKAEAVQEPQAPAATPDPEQPTAEKSPVDVAADIAAKEKAASAPAPTMPPPPAAETGIMETVMGVVNSAVASATGIIAGLNLGSDTLIFIAAPIGLVLLIILVIVIMRRRKGDNFQESILTGAATAGAEGGPASGDSTTFSEESSFLSDFAMSGASAIQADDSEVDPLTEADVFMAYGRHEAAEERLNEAIQNEPERMELRAKLLELYHATKNKASFESAAEDFYASLGGAADGNPLWEKAIALGTEIAPDNPLFNQSAAAGGVATPTASAEEDPGVGMTDSQVMDIGLETGVFQAGELSGDASDSGAPDLGDMDFNLDLGMDDSASAEPEAAPDAAGDMDFNLDLGESTAESEPESAPATEMDFNLDIGGDETAPVSEQMSAADAGELDFNLDMGMDAAPETPAESAADAGGLDFNLDMGMDAAPETPAEPAADAGGLDFDLDIGGGDDTPAAEPALDAGMDLNLDASDTSDAALDAGGGDEVGTKLDLAKAYIDMGDPEGARSILDEVMDEGNDSQKQEAQGLLSQIA